MPAAASAIRPVPRLRYRPTNHRDLAECFELLPPWLGLDAALAAALPQLWARLLDQPAITSTLMEDLALPEGRRIQGWGCGITLAPEWAERLGLASAPAPHVVRQVYAALHEGRLAPLSDREIGLANAQGRLTFLNLHYLQRHTDLDDPYAQSVLNIANEAFRVAAAGYKLQAMYIETSVADVPGIAAAGFFERPYADEAALQDLAPAWRPVLLGVSREQALAGLPGTSVRHVFDHYPPLFRFSASQRRLLWLALFDDSDSPLTERLEVSVHGLKKLWRGIYERIEDQMPGFFGEAAGDDDGKRGPEKRRQVLAYVRQRPEELRPWAAA